MRQKIIFAVSGAFALLISSVSDRPAMDAKASSREYTPVTLTERGIAYDQDGNIARATERIVALRSDGSQASFAMYEPRLRNIRTIEMIDGFRATIIDDLKVLSIVQMPEEEVEHAKRMRAALHCVFGTASLLRSESLQGAQVYVMEYSVPPRMLRITDWRAPEYACFPLRSTMEEPQQNGSYRLIAENVVTNLQNGEPNPRFFNMPADYEKLTHSALKLRYRPDSR